MTHLGYGSSAKKLRIGLANIMMSIGDYKGIFPNQSDVSLRDIFSVTDEVGRVYDCDITKIVQYSYDVMCRDMRTARSWKRLPMNLIMQFTSLLYDIEFTIIPSRADEVPLRVVWDEDRKYMNHVSLAKLGEVHYMPLEAVPKMQGGSSYYETDDQIALLKMQFDEEDQRDAYNNMRSSMPPINIDDEGYEYVESNVDGFEDFGNVRLHKD
jgi:hypothetical protein